LRASVATRFSIATLLCLLIPSAWADRAVPVWFDAAWHYRVPLTVPAATAVSSTVVVNVDFTALLTQLGISGTFDERSPRVVRPNGALVTTQEYNERVYNGVLDAATNGRGEVRFVAQDAAAAGTYYVYFDISGNGAKAANTATPINGTFEQSVGSTPTSWVVSALNAGGAQNDEVYRTALGATTTVAAGCATTAQSVDNSPARSGAAATGEAWMLLGYRDRCEDGSGEEHIRVSRDIAVPAGAAAGSLTFNFQVQGWDGISNATNYDWVIVSVNGTAVNHTALGINNTTTPQLVIDSGRFGRNAYNTTYLDHGWKQATLNLSAYAGSTINFRIESRHTSSDDDYRAWVKLDDVAWSVQAATTGTPQGFGANVISPNDTAVGSASALTTGQRVLVRAQVDATVASATADIYNNAGALVRGGVVLYDNGTHGDAAAGDRIWTNDGSVAAQPSYTILAADPVGANWRVRVFAPDASTSSVATNGLVHRPGLPNTPSVQANFFNIDEQLFTVFVTNLNVAKSVVTIRDPVNAAVSPKAIPGAWLEYTVTVTNTGPGVVDANSVVVVDTLPTTLSMCVTSACAAGGTPVRFDDSTSPAPTALTFNYATSVTYSTDGTTFGYTPVPDANGFDAAIRAVRIAPSGSMAAPTGAGNPLFRLRYVVLLL
jgi:uncharacterized repeat protein (TIGR01451 family)